MVKEEKTTEKETEISENKKDRNFIVSEKVLSATLNYLASRPYSDVAGLIQILSQSKALD